MGGAYQINLSLSDKEIFKAKDEGWDFIFVEITMGPNLKSLKHLIQLTDEIEITKFEDLKIDRRR